MLRKSQPLNQNLGFASPSAEKMPESFKKNTKKITDTFGKPGVWSLESYQGLASLSAAKQPESFKRTTEMLRKSIAWSLESKSRFCKFLCSKTTRILSEDYRYAWKTKCLENPKLGALSKNRGFASLSAAKLQESLQKAADMFGKSRAWSLGSKVWICEPF